MERISLTAAQSRVVAQWLLDRAEVCSDDDRIFLGQGRDPEVFLQVAWARESHPSVLDLDPAVERVGP